MTSGVSDDPVTRWVRVGEIDLAYETFGSPSDPATVLIMGLATQMIGWPDQMCASLAAGGRYVIRFDNRDFGLSSRLNHLGQPSLVAAAFRRVPYTIEDMARDVVGLMDALELGEADVVGVSMGGFMAQAVAIGWPERVRSLTLMMTSTGSRRVGQPSLRLIPLLLRDRTVIDLDRAIEDAVARYRAIGSPGFAFDEDYMRDRLAEGIRRSADTSGAKRHLAACVAQRDRTPGLRRLRVPAVVISGSADRLIPASGGRALARAIPDVELHVIDGLGHDLPRALWPEFVALINRAARRA